MSTMLSVEIRRCLSRRLVQWLVALAVVGCALTAALVHRTASAANPSNEFRFVELHEPPSEAFLFIGAFFLIIGAVVGGASMIGAEWRAGTFVTVMTWEPDRRRVAVTKLMATGIVASAIAVAIQVLFCAAFLPAGLGPGTMEGADAAWWRELAWAVLRVAGLTGLAAILMASVAMLGRNTAAALGAAFGYMMLFENLLRAWKPWAGRFLLGENSVMFLTGGNVEGAPFERSTSTALLTLTGYAALVAAASVVSFWRRDVTSAA
jgi:hypothetical protein